MADDKSLAALQHATEKLHAPFEALIAEFEKPGSCLNPYTAVKRINRWGDNCSKIPVLMEEWKRRAGLVEAMCRPGSRYKSAREKARKVAPKAPKGITAAGLALSNLCPPPAPSGGNLDDEIPGSLTLLADIEQTRNHLDMLLRDSAIDLDEGVRTAFELWRDECDEIEDQTGPYHPDGCAYLLAVYKARDETASGSSDVALEVLQRFNIGAAELKQMLEAADDMMNWARNSLSQESVAATSFAAQGAAFESEAIKSGHQLEGESLVQNLRSGVRANTSKLFNGDPPANPDIVDLVVRLDAQKASGRCKLDIARKFTGEPVGNSPKANNLLSQIRRFRRKGRILLD